MPGEENLKPIATASLIRHRGSTEASPRCLSAASTHPGETDPIAPDAPNTAEPEKLVRVACRGGILRRNAGKLDAEVPQQVPVVGIGNGKFLHGSGKRRRKFQVCPGGSGKAALRDKVGKKIPPGIAAREKTREQPGNLLDMGLFTGHCP
ncbi:hypothetical protein [Methanoculleus chikugoensis]|uniref:hypothetical protein n=1 Tax=Methanoculleus chikugoensis TaxID=118126 RepID=UPI000A59B73B|nr:hypothetical protein [Methanoculleus chikugoensis]